MPRGKVPSGKTITEYLKQQGLKPGTDLHRATHRMASAILKVGGGKRYEVGRVIAEGGMGVIYEARDLNCRRTVAMKVLPKDLPVQPDDLLRFIEEAQINSQLEHPNIVPVHELGLDADGNVFYTMKYVRGITLTEILLSIREGDQAIIDQYPLARLLNIFQKACDAVAFAHSRGVIHRDLKPDNIMIGDYGEVQVMDWGLAKILKALRAATRARAVSDEAAPLAPITIEPRGGAHPRAEPGEGVSSVRTDDLGTGLKTMDGRVMGSPGFMAPEQARAGGEDVDFRADIYSLGAILYSILTLRASVKGKDIRDILKRIVAGDIVPPAAHNETGMAPGAATHRAAKPAFPHCPGGHIPEALSDIVMKAMATNPADRYAAVRDFQRDVEAYQEGLIWHLVIDEDFSGGDLASRWDLRGGHHEIRDGELRVHGGEPQLVILKTDLPGDVRIEFECHQESVYLNDVGCFIAAAPSENHKEIPSSGYEFKYGAFDNSLNMLTKAGERLWSMPASPLVRGKRYKVCAERVGSRLRMAVNNEEIFSVTDPDPLSGSDHVVAGLLGWMADARYSRVRVYMLGTPWRADVLHMAERQMQKGRYDAAMGLFQEVLDSFPDAERRERAREGHCLAQHRQNIVAHLPAWREKLAQAWPGCTPQVRMTNDGLSVDVSNSDIRDLAPLEGLPITALYCAYCNVSSLEPLRGMPLTTLNCTGNPITDLAPLQGMRLFTLLCEDCPIKSLAPLRGLPLNMLQIGVCEVDSLEPLRGMDLTFLSCADSRIEDLEPLRGMPLVTLNFGGNRVASLDPLHGMPLNTLHCGGNRVTDLAPLRGLPLTVLHCGDNQIADLEPLRALTLNILSIHCNRVKSLEPLKNLPLSAMTCGGNLLTDLGPCLKKPPEDFLFDCDTVPTEELGWIHREWSRDFRFAAHARNVEIILALREGDPEKLKSLASEFKGHKYLFIPKFMRWEEARAFCEGLGGHLVTITSREEDEFVSSLFKGGCWFWIGLHTSKTEQAWVTGEPFDYHNFVDDLQRNKVGPKVFCRKWFSDHVPGAHNTFLIEWE
ncbi:MAG: protein kinase [Kiritimatiellae bacterium]|nr:protein kinase [Kiritimatiellia bacterium]